MVQKPTEETEAVRRNQTGDGVEVSYCVISPSPLLQAGLATLELLGLRSHVPVPTLTQDTTASLRNMRPIAFLLQGTLKEL